MNRTETPIEERRAALADEIRQVSDLLRRLEQQQDAAVFAYLAKRAQQLRGLECFQRPAYAQRPVEIACGELADRIQVEPWEIFEMYARHLLTASSNRVIDGS